MKLTLSILFFITAISFGSCQNSESTPEAVKQTFQEKYPGENDPDWHTDAHGNWEANFKKKGEKYRADFKPNGDWIETENSIKDSELPQAIKDKIKELYPDREITEVERVESASKGVFYDVEFKQKGKNMDVEFDSEGNILH
ncbi:PepSY-like domain-containing protein [Cochleicola gelatinilyticus]|uniref:Putative beta-lactamase-inhibitor-like PepSY-like domain-containing protein n=1 Tax=Cochleicola gelatinilyticus TaxID=1763537 RepID=A0A167J605_9FLAO|nr:PepSY-like domain-containing protein [Cochleicola gelatinilyticus]OAB80362.1 hypothetical protein ULVI_06405 [Cochleicola gelatinilyticus]